MPQDSSDNIQQSHGHQSESRQTSFRRQVHVGTLGVRKNHSAKIDEVPHIHWIDIAMTTDAAAQEREFFDRSQVGSPDGAPRI